MSWTDVRYVVTYEWEGGDDGIHLSASTPIPVPDVGELVYLDINSGDGPVRTPRVVSRRAFEVQRGTGFVICTVYVDVREPLPSEVI